MNKEEIINFKKQFAELKLPNRVKFEPFPFEVNFKPLDLSTKGRASVKIQLFDGTFVKLPLYNYLDKAIIFSNVKRYFELKDENHWEKINKFFSYFHIYGSYDTYSRILPIDYYIAYSKNSDECMQYISDCMNYFLNKESELVYPPNWFDVMKEVIKIRCSPIGINGDLIACYAFASPREFFKYFNKNYPNNIIVEKIVDNNM